MKNYKYNICFLFVLLLIFVSCEKSEIARYESTTNSVNFSTPTSEFSFSLSTTDYDTLDIKFSINGTAVDYVRNANISVLNDSTTALDTEYKILSAVVDTNSYEGVLKVEVTKNGLDSIPDRRIWLTVDNNEDFTTGIKAQSVHKLILTNKLVYPYRWGTYTSYLSKYLLGTYSTSYYQWLIDVSGHTQFPYPRAIPGYRDGLKWDYSFKLKFRTWLKDQLKIYNASIAPDFLKHSDGIAEGEAVVIGYNKKP